MPDKYGFSFFWTRLVESLDDHDELNAVMDKLRQFLSRHGEVIGSSSRVQILVLIMMLREFITVRATADMFWLATTIAAIRPYFQWPRPYSLIARQLLDDLCCECICPGAALRRRLRLEHPNLDPDRDSDEVRGDIKKILLRSDTPIPLRWPNSHGLKLSMKDVTVELTTV